MTKNKKVYTKIRITVKSLEKYKDLVDKLGEPQMVNSAFAYWEIEGNFFQNKK